MLTIFYMLYSYIIKAPNYLETEEAIQEKQEELEEKRLRKEKLNQKTIYAKDSDYKNRLVELKNLRDAELITQEEYINKKKEIIEKF